MHGNSRQVSTNQHGIHPGLDRIVSRHLEAPNRRPYPPHALESFARAQAFLESQGKPLLLDSCCGVGDSSRALAHRHPDHCVIGVDKSVHRLARERGRPPGNLLLLRADLNDFYRLLAGSPWVVERHTLLYPNPWPKAKHIQRRWHGSAAFPAILQLGGALELRSNWRLYLEEFQRALALAGVASDLEEIEVVEPITAFEAKYRASAQPLFRLLASAL